MIDFLRLSKMVGRDFLQDFLLSRDAIAKSRELLRTTNTSIDETYRLLGPGNKRPVIGRRHDQAILAYHPDEPTDHSPSTSFGNSGANGTMCSVVSKIGASRPSSGTPDI